MKGMLTGDLSTFAIKQILKSIEAYLPQMEAVQKEIEQILKILDNEKSVSQFMAQNFKINT